MSNNDCLVRGMKDDKILTFILAKNNCFITSKSLIGAPLVK